MCSDVPVRGMGRRQILDKYGVRLNVLGNRSLLPPNVQIAIEKAENMTRHNSACVML